MSELDELAELLNRIPKQYGGPPINREEHDAAMRALKNYSETNLKKQNSKPTKNGSMPSSKNPSGYKIDYKIDHMGVARRMVKKILDEKKKPKLVKLDEKGGLDEEIELEKTLIQHRGLNDTDVQDFGDTLVQDPRLVDTVKKTKKGGKTKRRGVRRTNSRQRRSKKLLKQ
jgi:hypothetical protein